MPHESTIETKTVMQRLQAASTQLHQAEHMYRAVVQVTATGLKVVGQMKHKRTQHVVEASFTYTTTTDDFYPELTSNIQELINTLRHECEYDQE